MKVYLKNSFFGIFQLIVSIVLVFFSIPVFINTYGLKLYGIFAVLSIFGNLTILLNLGLNTTLLKFISQNKSEQLRNGHTTAALIMIGAITFFFTAVLFLFQHLMISDLLSIDNNFKGDATLIYCVFLISNVFIMLGQPFVALIQSSYDFYLVSIIQWLYNLLNWGGIIFLCKFHYDFRFIAYPALLSSLLWFLLLLYFALRKYGYKILIVSPEFKLISVIKLQFNYSIQVYFNSLLTFFNEPLLKILVLKYSGPQAAGSLDIILRIKAQLIGLFTKAFEPLSATIAGKTDVKIVRSIVHYTEQLALTAFIPLCLMIYAFSGTFLHLWMKGISNTMIFETKISVIIFTISMIVVPNYYYLTFHGKIRDCIRIQILSITISLTAFFIAIRYNKNAAPVISICLGIIAALTLCIYYQWKYLKSLIFDNKTFKSLFILTALAVTSILSYHFNFYRFNFLILALSLVFSFKYISNLLKQGKLKFLE